MATKKTTDSTSDAEKPANKAEDLSSKQPVFDVSKPGSTAANPTSRPTIVGHSPMIKKDPMMAPDGDTYIEEIPETTAPSAKLKIEPLNKEDTKPRDKNPGDEVENGVKKDETVESDPAKPEETKAPESSDSGAVEVLAGEVNAKKKDKDSAAKQDELKKKIASLINSKQFFLPITEGGRKRSAERLIAYLLVFVILGAAGGVLAVDAGYIDYGIKLPFDLIKN